ncbi:hypothetical protein PIB30_059689 [Stylosanthes scabra]|uniref:Uncharacterized protein n=1 Tax=Stylosanthes scabra TaxID=79078 RepID=A0ABU6QLA8_9FABA|nr:hypothetical protein [Stylosanthes scabra]
MNGRHKVEKKVTASQIAFGYGGEAKSFKLYHNCMGGSENSAFSGVREKEYKEPWDYYYSYQNSLMKRNLGRLQNPESMMKIQQIKQRSLDFWNC